MKIYLSKGAFAKVRCFMMTAFDEKLEYLSLNLLGVLSTYKSVKTLKASVFYEACQMVMDHEAAII